MNDFIVYILKSAIWIAVFYGIYRFFFLNETFLRFNRKFLFAGMITPFALALCQFHYPVEVMNFTVSETESVFATVVSHNGVDTSFSWVKFFLFVYFTGVLTFILYYGLGLNKIRKLIHKQNINSGENKVVYTSGIYSSFSAFGYVFMDQSGLQEIEKEIILTHETAHVEQRHWIDVLAVQFVCIFQWFNPFAWLYLKAVKQNHEFLADRSVIDKGYSQAVYQAVLVNSTFKVPVFAFTNSFAYYHKFKRIEIMKKKISSPAKKLAVLLLLPAFAGFLAAFAKPEYHYSIAPSQPETVMPVLQDTIKIDVNPQALVKVVDSKPAQTNQKIKVSGQVWDTDGKPIAGAAIIQKNGKTGTISDENGKFSLSVPGGSELQVFYIDKKTAVVSLKNTGKNDFISITLEGEQDKSEKYPAVFIYDKASTDNNANSPLFIIDGKEHASIGTLNDSEIESITVLKSELAVSKYGEKGKNGVIIIDTIKKTTE